MNFTKLPNPIRETQVLKLVFITRLCLKFWALGLFTFLPECTVHNMRLSELGVHVYSSLVLPKYVEYGTFLLQIHINVF